MDIVMVLEVVIVDWLIPIDCEGLEVGRWVGLVICV